VTKAKTPTGVIFYGGPCKDDYANMRIYDQPPKGGSPIKLQGPALRSLKDAEKKLGKPIYLTGSWRSCAYQRELYTRDPKRYAHPDGTFHTRGLAIDVSQSQSKTKLARIHSLLTKRGWKQARSDEPWHYSYWIAA
jgi:LAS superfamily LD-carboxypeptidase LdcB